MSSAPPDITDRSKSLSAFDKINCAIKLMNEAVKEYPKDILYLDRYCEIRSLLKLKLPEECNKDILYLDRYLEIRSLLITLSAWLQILSQNSSQLKLPDLIIKHGWFVGQRFYVRVSVLSVSELSFSVKPDQDIPEGVVIFGNKRNMSLEIGESIAIDVDTRRRENRTVYWRIRAIDRE